MARTKKEIEEQAPDAEQETTGTESDPVPQTEQETPPGEVANAGVTDLELAAAKSLDPDAPQTDLESGDDPDGQAAPPQTDPEWDPDSQSESGQGTFSSQTDMESADSNAGSQTDLEPAEEPGDGQAFDPTADLGSQTEPETEPDEKASTQSEGDAAAEGDAEPPAPPRRRRTSRKKAAEVQEAQDGGEDVPAEEEQSESGQPQKLRMPGRRRQRVVSIDAERTVETDTDRLRNDLLDLVESLKSQRILTGTIQGVERSEHDPDHSMAVLYHGDFKVILPAEQAVEAPSDLRGRPKGEVLFDMLNKRLGAEVDYIVKGMDDNSGLAAASRLEARAKKRREHYFGVDRAGLVGEDGETHHGVFDIAYLGAVPGMTVWCPASLREAADMLHQALYGETGPVALRYPRGSEGEYTDGGADAFKVLREGTDVTIAAYGTMINEAVKAAESLANEGVSAKVVKLGRVLPLNAEPVLAAARETGRLVVAEEVCASGCIGGRILASAGGEAGFKCRLLNLGEGIVGQGGTDKLRSLAGIDAAGIAAAAKELMA